MPATLRGRSARHRLAVRPSASGGQGGVWGLVAPAVFNTDVAQDLGQAGSIPVRLRRPSRLARCEAAPGR